MNRHYSRREFMGEGLGLVGFSATVPAFLARSVWAGEGHVGPRPDRDAPVLVVLQLAGGNDGLNTVVPFRNDDYYRTRPKLAIARDRVHRINDELGLHPNATELKRLYDAGALAIVEGVGYPNPSRSHFVSTQVWQSGDPRRRLLSGWIGRYCDATCRGTDPPDPKLGIAVTKEVPRAMVGDTFTPVSFTSPEELRWKPDSGNRGAQPIFERFNGSGPTSARQPAPSPAPSHAPSHAAPHTASSAPPPTPSPVPLPVPSLVRSPAPSLVPLSAPSPAPSPAPTPAPPPSGGGRAVTPLDYVRRTALNARVDAGRIRAAAAGTGDYRYRLQSDLAMVASMIAAGLPTRVYYVALSGFDTHARQWGRHDALVTQLGAALSTFARLIRQHKLTDRVLLMTFSEFGRRAAENASGGTDHGKAAPMFLIGASVRAGVHGRSPSLRPADLDEGDPRHTVDFRSIYASVLRDWMGADADRILGAKSPHMNLIANDRSA